MSRVLTLGAIGMLAIAGVAEPAAAKKKKKKKPTAVTAVASSPISPGAQTAATANCPSKTHITGGGWSIASPYNANGTTSLANDTGTRITHLESHPNGTSSWTAGAAAFNLPANASTFTTVARCESKSLGRAITGVSGTSTVPAGQESTTDLVCPPGTHALTGGFSFTPAGNLAMPASFRAIVVESRRLNVTTWRVHLVNPFGAPSQATIFTNVVCEVNAKGVNVTEASAVAPIVNDDRTTATATCTGKTHTVGGGFVTSPLVGPAVGIDQMQPVGAKAWQIGLYEYPGFNLPAGSSLAAYSYCKKNAPPAKKKRK